MDARRYCLPRQAWETCEIPKKNYKSEFVAFEWMSDIRKLFKKWDLEKYLKEERILWEQVEKHFKASLWQKWATNAKHRKLAFFCDKIIWRLSWMQKKQGKPTL